MSNGRGESKRKESRPEKGTPVAKNKIRGFAPRGGKLIAKHRKSREGDGGILKKEG